MEESQGIMSTLENNNGNENSNNQLNPMLLNNFSSAEDFSASELKEQYEQHIKKLDDYFKGMMDEIKNMKEKPEAFKQHKLPLARIKKIMKCDEDVKMISAEAPILFAKACELFITDLTFRAYFHTQAYKRRTLQKVDIATCIANCEMFDFLLDIVPRDEHFKIMNREYGQQPIQVQNPMPAFNFNLSPKDHPRQTLMSNPLTSNAPQNLYYNILDNPRSISTNANKDGSIKD